MSDFQSEAAFLEAWQRGVELAGVRFFGDGTNISAVSKWDLEPDWGAIQRAMGVLSTGEALFLAAMYSFYNASSVKHLYSGNIAPGAIGAALDEPRRRVIADLTVSYTGW